MKKDLIRLCQDIETIKFRVDDPSSRDTVWDFDSKNGIPIDEYFSKLNTQILCTKNKSWVRSHP